jgi:hypothetical protein
MLKFGVSTLIILSFWGDKFWFFSLFYILTNGFVF